MIDRLCDYAYKRGLALPPGLASRSVRWALGFDAQGAYVGVLPLGDTSDKRNAGQAFPCCPDLTQGELVTLKGCHFLVEAAEVVALHQPSGQPSAKSEAKHAFFVGLLQAGAAAVPGLAGPAAALSDPDRVAAIQQDLARCKAKATDKVTIRLQESFVVEETSWHEWWQEYRRTHLGGPADDAAERMVCFATGERVAAAATHPKVSGLSDVGGIGMGSSLVGFDKDAFPSYGLKQSANAAMSDDAAAACRAALNDLLAHHAKRFPGCKVVHWFRAPVEEADDPLAWLEAPDDAAELSAQRRADELLSAIRAGTRPDLLNNQYHALSLSGAGGRVMIRDWMEGRFEELVVRVRSWFDDLAIVRRDGLGLAPPPKFLAVLAATARELDEVPTPAAAHLWRAALAALPITEPLAARALARWRIDCITGGPANHARIGLLRAYIVRKGDAHLMPTLNTAHPRPAYHCGRLMAVLADLQRAALPGVDAGVVQRFYASASATPALVLGRLTRTSQFHLNKLSGGLAAMFEQRIAGIWAQLGDSVPSVLTMEEQSLFALGYYQQMAADRADRAEKSAARKAGATEPIIETEETTHE
ncbi:MAG: type I-C CRISPR-associated protein Cas8c/Csd1 [Armatimonadetes bacterium]|nr:type I-C CRISPR-associated protein Cas8c/Csd1 [Armatimonadota bacterium]